MPEAKLMTSSTTGRRGGWWGVAFVVTLFVAGAMVSLPTAKQGGRTIEAFYAAHTGVILAQQVLGVVTLAFFLAFALALGARRRRWLLVGTVLLAIAELATNIPPSILALTSLGPDGAHVWTVVEDLADEALFISVAVFSVAATIDEVGGVRAGGLVLGHTGYRGRVGGGLHIAHMLWGGTMMVAAVLLLLSNLGQRIRRAAAVVAGLGFGLFIDELGKFITSDNNYFYRPAIALIYVVFVLLFLWWRSLERHRVWDEQTYLANALMLLQDAALHDLDPTEKYHLVRWLRQSGDAGTALLGNIEQEVAARRPDLPRRSPLAARLRWIQRRVEGVLRSRWTGRIAIAVLLIRLLAAVTASLALVYAPNATGPGETVDLPLLLASAVSGGLTLVGVVYLILRSRAHALRWFRRSILATIFLTDLFTFYYQQLGAVADLAVDLILLAVFEALLEAEHRRAGHVGATAD